MRRWMAAVLSVALLLSCGIQALAAPVAVKSKTTAEASFPLPVASGTLTEENGKAIIDYSHTADGYVMVKYTASTNKKLKAQVKCPDETAYTYNITAGEYATFPLSEGDGGYQVIVYENVSGDKYATVLSAAFSVTMKDEFAPFLMPNQYVNYTPGSGTVKKAAELTGKIADPLEKVKVIYDFVVKNITYDKNKAATVKSGYLPVLDTVLKAKTGICFDYAALMAGMLRSQNVPVKLVIGYSGKIYHAWINVYSEETGWIDSVIYFDGITWKLMDPTFASSAKQSKKIMAYIGDGANYSAKYVY
ncbi:MAG: transglutaminase-like domain-containing protein [Oscillospiraceae bacterium]